MSRSKWLDFVPLPVPPSRKTVRVEIRSRVSGDRLGIIAWYVPWRCYTFRPAPSTIWNRACMDDVQAKIADLEHEQAIARALRKAIK